METIGASERIWRTTRSVFWTADSTASRATVALASLLWVVALVLDPHTLDRPPYALMRSLPVWFWALGFGLHGVLGFWRIYERKARVGWSIIVNTLGLLMWLGFVVANTLTNGELPAASALEWVVCFRMAVIVIRSGLNSEITTP